MKLLLFDDFKLGVLRGDAVVDVSDTVKDIPHTGPARPDQRPDRPLRGLPRSVEDAADRGKRRAARPGQDPPAAAQAHQHRLHGGELHGGRHPHRAGADQRLPEVARRGDRRRRHRWCCPTCPPPSSRARPRWRWSSASARRTCRRRERWSYIFGYCNFIDGSARGLLPPGNTFYQMKSRDTFAPIGPYLVTADEITDPHKLAGPALGERHPQAELQHQRHGPQDPALHRVGHRHPHPRAGRHPRHRDQPPRTLRLPGRRPDRARDRGPGHASTSTCATT